LCHNFLCKMGYNTLQNRPKILRYVKKNRCSALDMNNYPKPTKSLDYYRFNRCCWLQWALSTVIHSGRQLQAASTRRQCQTPNEPHAHEQTHKHTAPWHTHPMVTRYFTSYGYLMVPSAREIATHFSKTMYNYDVPIINTICIWEARMKKYKYTELTFHSNGVFIASTHLDSIYPEINAVIMKMFPKAKVSTDYYLGKKVYGVSWSNLSKQEYGVGYWVLEYFCSQGWEPYDHMGATRLLRFEEQFTD
jgi:hypothetical protein